MRHVVGAVIAALVEPPALVGEVVVVRPMDVDDDGAFEQVKASIRDLVDEVVVHPFPTAPSTSRSSTISPI